LAVTEGAADGEYGAPLYSRLTHNGKYVGSVDLRVRDLNGVPTARMGHAVLEPGHRGKRLGNAMYEAVLAHAKNQVGATHAEGSEHSSMAARVHESLARKHGMRYFASRTGETDSGPYDSARGDYRYRLKSELPMAKSEAYELLAHPDPRERALALKLSGTTPADIGTAILDPDPLVWRAAFNHPHSGHALDVLAASHRDSAGVPLYDRHDALLADPRVSEHHLASMYRAAQGDSELPHDVQMARLLSLTAHPKMSPSSVGLPMAKHWGHETIRHGSVSSPASASEEEPMPHLAHHAEAWHHHALDAQPHPIPAEMEGVSPKVVYHLPNTSGTGAPTSRYMVKPYAEHDSPLSGWSEATSQHLYHAAGIGHLHQQSFVAPHGAGKLLAPATVIHLENAQPVNHVDHDEVARKNPGIGEDARRVGVMDFLTDNTDRHGENLMVRPDGSLMAIDHAGSFHYPLVGRDASHSFDHTSGSPVIHLGSYGPTNEYHENFGDTLKWWRGASGDVRRAFQERMDLVRSPAVEERLRRGFEERADRLDQWAWEAAEGRLPRNWHKERRGPGALAKKLGDADFIGDHHDRFRLQAPANAHAVDHATLAAAPLPHHVAATADYFERNINGPTPVSPVMLQKKGQALSNEPKAVYEHGGHHFMVKPAMGLNGFGAWAEQTSQHLYDAAQIGHLHQSSHVTSHAQPWGKEPALVVHIAPGALTVSQATHVEGANAGRLAALKGMPEHRESARRIGIMDFLTSNFDRHEANLMVHPGGAPLAIDHGMAFHADRVHAMSPSSRVEDQEREYSELLGGNEALYFAYDPATEQTYRWWKAAKPAILERMDQQLQHVADPDVRARMRANFRHRAEQVEPMMRGSHASSEAAPMAPRGSQEGLDLDKLMTGDGSGQLQWARSSQAGA
jgi:hypothetical protein